MKKMLMKLSNKEKVLILISGLLLILLIVGFVNQEDPYKEYQIFHKTSNVERFDHVITIDSNKSSDLTRELEVILRGKKTVQFSELGSNEKDIDVQIFIFHPSSSSGRSGFISENIAFVDDVSYIFNGDLEFYKSDDSVLVLDSTTTKRLAELVRYKQ